MKSKLYRFSCIVSLLGMNLLHCSHFPIVQVSAKLNSSPTEFPSPLQKSDSDLQAHTPTGFSTHVLQNGLRVSLLTIPESTTVAIHLSYGAATAHQPADAPELAHLLEHMILYESSPEHPKESIYDKVSLLGGKFGASTEAEATNYRFHVPPVGLEEVLSLAAQSMREAKLTQETFLNQQKSVQEEYNARLSINPAIPVILNALGRLLNGHSYGKYFTAAQDWKKISLAQVIEFYQRYYQPNNAHLVIVGAIDIEKTNLLIEKYFGAIPNRNQDIPAKMPSLYTWPFPQKVKISQPEVPIKAALQIYRLPPPKNEDNTALWVLSEMLCPTKWQQGFCLSDQSPLFEEMVKKQHNALAAGIGFARYDNANQTDIHVGIAPFQAGGALFFYAAYLPYRTQSTAFRLLNTEIHHLAKFSWLTEENLLRSKRQIIKKIYTENYDPIDQAEALSLMKQMQDDERYAFDRVAAIKSVTHEDIKRVFHRYIVSQTPTSLYIVPEKVPAWIRLFGWLYPVAYPLIKHPLIPEESEQE